MSAPLTVRPTVRPTARRRTRPGPVASLLSVVALVGLAALAGCSGDDSASGSDDAASASAAPTESAAEPTGAAEAEETDETEETAGTDETAALPRAPKARNTVEGRKAFAEFVVERWGYALATNDADALADLSAKGSTCQGCRELEKELAQRRKEGWAVDFPGASVERTTVRPAGSPASFEATAVVDIPASRSYFDDGTYRNENEAFKNAEFVVGMRFTPARYVLVSYRVA